MPKRPVPVYVEWLDHNAPDPDASWVDATEVAEVSVCHSVGYLISETPDALVIAHTAEDGECIGRFVLVRAAVVRVERLRLPRVKRTKVHPD